MVRDVKEDAMALGSGSAMLVSQKFAGADGAPIGDGGGRRGQQAKMFLRVSYCSVMELL